MRAPVVTFLSDYGLQDGFVGVCHGVIAEICPQARVIDISHGVARHDVRAGAVILAGAIAFMPAGVHLAVVDPDVGAERRALALASEDGRLFVGPDNGLLVPAAQGCGGIVEAVEIMHSPLRLEPVSATFHGRDVFAPIAAHLAAGEALGDVGEPLAVAELVELVLPGAELRDGQLVTGVTYVDRFGNVQLGASHEHAEAGGLRLGRQVQIDLRSGASCTARYVRTFADARRGEVIVYEDSSRMLALAVSHGSAAEQLGLASGDEVILS
jgi:S-adenosyl-L-methionine hydrolase (adenosine-forming)